MLSLGSSPWANNAQASPKGASFFHQRGQNWAHWRALLPILGPGHEGKLWGHVVWTCRGRDRLHQGLNWQRSHIRKATGHRVLGGCPCKHTQISAQALQPRFLQAESPQPVCLVPTLLPYAMCGLCQVDHRQFCRRFSFSWLVATLQDGPEVPCPMALQLRLQSLCQKG